MLRFLVPLLLCMTVMFQVSAQVKNENVKKKKPVTVFSVSGEPVTAAEFIYLYKKNHADKPDEFTKEKIDEYLDLFINFKLKVTEARKRGMDTTVAFLKEYNSYRAELRKPYLPDNSLADSLTKLTYERMKEDVRASHILVGLKADATPADTLAAFKRITELRNKILAGEDFGKVAMQFSEDQSAKTNQGDLGYFTAMGMVYPFETAAYSTPVGTVSLPVRTRFGYHLIKVTGRRPAQGEIEVSHIMIRVQSEKDEERARNLIFSIVDQLQAGVKWEELCNQYSEDPATKEDGGRLRPFTVGAMASVPQFERAAFDLQKPGDISDPVKTQYGWHIIRLEKKTPVASYETLATSLKARVLRDERTTVSKQAIQERLRRRYSWTENPAVKQKVLSTADSGLLNVTWRVPATYPAADKDVLFTLRGKPFYAKDFLVYVQRNQRSNALAPGRYMEQLYGNYVENRIMEEVELDIIKDNPTYSYLQKEYYEGILLFEIMEKEVWSKASADSSGQRKYYEEHKSKYQAGDRTKAVIYTSSAREGMGPLEDLVKKGDERKVQEYISAAKIRMETGYFKKDEKEIFGSIPWSRGVYSGENKGMYYLAWLKDILPAGSMAFEEARPAIISDYQAFLEKIWLEQLKKKYSIKINAKGKRYVIQELQGK